MKRRTFLRGVGAGAVVAGLGVAGVAGATPKLGVIGTINESEFRAMRPDLYPTTVCTSMGEWLEHLLKFRETREVDGPLGGAGFVIAGRVLTRFDDPKWRRLGFVDISTGHKYMLPMTRAKARCSHFRECPECGEGPSAGRYDYVLPRLGISRRGLSDYVRTPAGRERLMKIVPRSWEDRGWIVVSPDLPVDFERFTWGQLKERLGSPLRTVSVDARQTRVIGLDGNQMGVIMALDTNTKTAWQMPLLLVHGTEAEIAQAQQPPNNSDQKALLSYLGTWTDNRPLVPVKYAHLERRAS